MRRNTMNRKVPNHRPIISVAPKILRYTASQSQRRKTQIERGIRGLNIVFPPESKGIQ